MSPSLDQTFAALSDPTRRALLARLAQGEASVNELAQPFLKTMSLPAVTKHLKVLERTGLVDSYRVLVVRARPTGVEGGEEFDRHANQVGRLCIGSPAGRIPPALGGVNLPKTRSASSSSSAVSWQAASA